MEMWGGGGSMTETAPEVTEDSIYAVVVPGTLISGEPAVPERQIIVVRDRDSDRNHPTTLPKQTVREGQRLALSESDLLKGLPAGTTVTVAGQPLSSWVAPEVDRDTDTTMQLYYTYADGTVGTAPLQVRVLNKFADAHTPTAASSATVLGGRQIAIPVGGVPTTTKVEGNVFMAPAVASDTTVQHKIVFTYADGSVDTLTVPVLVKASLAGKNPVQDPQPVTVKENEKVTVKLPASVASLSLGSGAPSGASLSGNTLTFNPGTLQGSKKLLVPVVYTYEDGSANTVTVTFLATDTTPPNDMSSTSGIVTIVLTILGILATVYQWAKQLV